MPRSADETRELFDEWGATYEHDLQRPSGPLAGYDSSLRQAARLIRLPPVADLLDIGIGTGRFASLLARDGVRIWGIDVSERMLAESRSANPTWDLQVGSFEHIPYLEGEFDAVVSSFAFHEVAPTDRAYATHELFRVLRPGGSFCVLDIVFASDSAREGARREIGPLWDADEEYALVGDLDGFLRMAGFVSLVWRQTAPYHWAVAGRRPLIATNGAEAAEG